MKGVRPAVSLLLLLAATTGCGGEAGVEPHGDAVDTVVVYFTRGGRQEAVRRDIALTSAPLEPAIRALLAGPTPAERQAGYTSHFSESTAAAFNRVEIRSDGLAFVDLFDFSKVAPSGADGGGAQLLAELNLTVFQFEQVRSVIYRFDGSCTRFWNWLERACETVRRADVTMP